MTSPHHTRRRRRKKHKFRLILLLVLAIFSICLLGFGIARLITAKKVQNQEPPSFMDVQLIAVDGVSRRGEKLSGVKDIVIHYVANPGSTAQQNRDFYENPASEVSSHFVVGLEGEVIQCVPLDEKSSASNWRNTDTLSIEVCHPDESGQFNEASYQALVKLTAWLCNSYGLSGQHIIRHFDITGKQCPLYYVQNEAAWQQFIADVKTAQGEL